MKKTIDVFLFVVVFCSVDTLLNAQSEIFFSIQKEEIEGEEWVRIFITNHNPEDMHLFSSARWDNMHETHHYFRDPSSFIRFVRNPGDSVSRYQTGRIILSKDIILESTLAKILPLTLKAGETHTEVYRLFGENYYPVRTFLESAKSRLKELQVELKLVYMYGKEEGYREDTILSNVLEYVPFKDTLLEEKKELYLFLEEVYVAAKGYRTGEYWLTEFEEDQFRESMKNWFRQSGMYPHRKVIQGGIKPMMIRVHGARPMIVSDGELKKDSTDVIESVEIVFEEEETNTYRFRGCVRAIHVKLKK